MFGFSCTFGPVHVLLIETRRMHAHATNIKMRTCVTDCDAGRRRVVGLAIQRLEGSASHKWPRHRKCEGIDGEQIQEAQEGRAEVCYVL